MMPPKFTRMTACVALAAATAAATTAGARTPLDSSDDVVELPHSWFLPDHIRESRAVLAANGGNTSVETAAAMASLFDDFLGALSVLQGSYFEPWLGQWPTGISWTSAVTGTHVAAALSSLSQGISAAAAATATTTTTDGTADKENLITTYFSQLLSYYFGQDAFAIRNEAYDDMLWVVLGWLETIEFIDYHATVFELTTAATAAPGTSSGPPSGPPSGLRNQSWHGNLWIPAFAHRARIFYDLATHGWDTTLCGGGMTWNPRLEPYKNAITNQLFIAASASMYLYFPGDSNASPFFNTADPAMAMAMGGSPSVQADSSTTSAAAAAAAAAAAPHEAKHLQAALDGYKWLTQSGMTNDQGLYVDGFHISGYKNASSTNKRCDARNDMVYTYNQGVVLTGLMGLWKATGDQTYLNDGHRLIQSVINATGYDLGRDKPVDDMSKLKPGQLPPWRGLGRAGILEEDCDIGGKCSQDSQTFKGIFFHHLTTFCAPLDLPSVKSMSKAAGATTTPLAHAFFQRGEADHQEACASYFGWVQLNAEAALASRDKDGKFGMWWTAGLLNLSMSSLGDYPSNNNAHASSTRVDYRSYGVPHEAAWADESALDDATGLPVPVPVPVPVLAGDSTDPNSRGRGRTVETQGGGLAVVRCLWEFTQRAAATTTTTTT